MPTNDDVAILPDSVRVVRYAEVEHRLHNGCSILDIARFCGVTPQAIHYHLREMGYTYSRTQGWRQKV